MLEIRLPVVPTQIFEDNTGYPTKGKLIFKLLLFKNSYLRKGFANFLE